MPHTTLTPSRLWKQMTSAQRLSASRAFWQDGEAADDQRQASLLIAQRKKFRPKTVMGLDLDRKAKHLASLPSIPDTIAGRMLIVYHLSDQRPMMARFLDALGIAHEDGLIKDEAAKPDPAKIGAAIADITREYPADDVRLYLNTLLCQDPDTWSAVADAVGQ
jgi:hypothetical protein